MGTTTHALVILWDPTTGRISRIFAGHENCKGKKCYILTYSKIRETYLHIESLVYRREPKKHICMQKHSILYYRISFCLARGRRRLEIKENANIQDRKLSLEVGSISFFMENPFVIYVDDMFTFKF